MTLEHLVLFDEVLIVKLIEQECNFFAINYASPSPFPLFSPLVCKRSPWSVTVSLVTNQGTALLSGIGLEGATTKRFSSNATSFPKVTNECKEKEIT